MSWNFDMASAPRDGSQILMATTDGKRFLTKWLMPNKFTPSGRFDGFSENAKTLLAWGHVPAHPNIPVQDAKAVTAEPKATAEPEPEQSVQIRRPDPLFILDDCGSGA